MPDESIDFEPPHLDSGLRARAARKYKAATQPKHSLPVVPNRLGQDFTAQAPNRSWTADITSILTEESWPYLAVVFDMRVFDDLGVAESAWGPNAYLQALLL